MHSRRRKVISEIFFHAYTADEFLEIIPPPAFFFLIGLTVFLKKPYLDVIKTFRDLPETEQKVKTR